MTRSAGEGVSVRLRDASAVRRFMKSPTAKRLRRTRLGRYADTWLLRRRAASPSARQQAWLQEVTTVCLFIGHVKSGGSLVGAMLDAHPDIVMGDEVDLARLDRASISGDAMLAEFARSARREAMKGRVTARRLGGYSLEITGWNQGRSDEPRVIGDSRPGPTTRYLADMPDALPSVLDSFSGRRVVFLHVIRRPEDSIAAMVLRSGRDVVDAATDHSRQCERLDRLRGRLGDSVYPIRYESLLEDCPGTLSGILEFLQMDPDPDYLAACSDLIDRGRVPESTRVSWNQAAIDIVENTVNRHEFLAEYHG
jgi:hypothetical protein